MFVALSCFEVQNGMEDQVKQAFRDRPKLVDNYTGFISLEVLSPLQNPAEIWLLTHWDKEDSFKSWHKNHLHDSHQAIPQGIKLVPHSFKLLFFNHIAS